MAVIIKKQNKKGRNMKSRTPESKIKLTNEKVKPA